MSHVELPHGTVHYRESGAGAPVVFLHGWLKKRPVLPANRQQALGLPADFLLAPDGHVLAYKYGVHAYDQWSVDDLLHLASKHIRATDHRLRL